MDSFLREGFRAERRSSLERRSSADGSSAGADKAPMAGTPGMAGDHQKWRALTCFYHGKTHGKTMEKPWNMLDLAMKTGGLT